MANLKKTARRMNKEVRRAGKDVKGIWNDNKIKLTQAEKRVEAYIRKHPARATLIAAGVGVVLGGAMGALRRR